MRTIRELRESKEPIYAKNKTRSIITANDSTSRFELLPDSVQSLPKEKLNLPGILNLIRQGSLEVGLEEDFEEELQMGIQTYQEAKKAQEEELDSQITENRSSKDLIERTCLITNKKVFQSMEDIKKGVPPLDESVQHRSGEFVATQTENEEEPYVFTRVAIDPSKEK